MHIPALRSPIGPGQPELHLKAALPDHLGAPSMVYSQSHRIILIVLELVTPCIYPSRRQAKICSLEAQNLTEITGSCARSDAALIRWSLEGVCSAANQISCRACPELQGCAGSRCQFREYVILARNYRLDRDQVGFAISRHCCPLQRRFTSARLRINKSNYAEPSVLITNCFFLLSSSIISLSDHTSKHV